MTYFLRFEFELIREASLYQRVTTAFMFFKNPAVLEIDRHANAVFRPKNDRESGGVIIP